MFARDVMATDLSTVAPNAPLHVIATTMVDRSVTGVAVVDGGRRLLGLVTEGDLLHRLAAAETDHGHGYLWGIFHSISRQADEYARTHGHLAADVMTLAEDLVTATQDTTAEHMAKVMEERRFRHMPVVHDEGTLIGMVTRAHLLRAALQLPEHRNSASPDNVVRTQVLRAMRELPWTDTHFTYVSVEGGVVTFSGLVRNERVKRGLRALAEQVPGVRDVMFNTQPTPSYWVGAP